MKVGYSYWGFLADIKYNNKYQEISTPDGNAFYSWSIIKSLQDNGHSVIRLLPDRDKYCVEVHKDEAFKAFAKNKRFSAYVQTYDIYDLCELDFAIVEWRWKIPGRNCEVDKNSELYQPDYDLHCELLNKLNKLNIPFVVFDLDYKLTEQDVAKYNIKYVIELGDKWSKSNLVKSKRVQIPFDFSHINEFEVIQSQRDLVYIGNRYERDWCIDKYIPIENEISIKVFGDWNESGRDSKEKWPHIDFGKRLQTIEMRNEYAISSVTPLFAKREYCEQGFMTARIIEAIFYGCVPLFISEFKGLEKYCPQDLREVLVVHDKSDVVKAAKYFSDLNNKKYVIYKLREHLKFMDANRFVKEVIGLLFEEK